MQSVSIFWGPKFVSGPLDGCVPSIEVSQGKSSIKTPTCHFQDSFSDYGSPLTAISSN